MANYISKHTGKQIDSAVDAFLAGGGTGSVEVDATLTQAGKAADAKATGDRLTALSEEKMDKDFGVENAGAALVVGADGKVAVLIEESGEEVETPVTPVRVYAPGNIYIVTSSGRLFVQPNQYVTTAAYRVEAGKKYRFSAWSKNGITTTYALADAVYDMPESGFNTGAKYSSYQSEDAGYEYDYEIVPETDCYLYVQMSTPFNSTNGDDDPNDHVVVVTGGTAKKEEAYPLYSVIEDGNGIEISYPYADGTLTVTLNKRGGNNLFDFRSIKTKAETLFDATISDWHSPFVVAAVNNADGDTPDNQYFTGGSHQTSNSGTGGAVTARTSALIFYADGKLLAAGDAGHADRIEMRWTNLVQGYNTSKADGNGREILQENHTLTFVNGKFEAYVEIIPLEAVTMKTYYGLQAIMTSKWANIRYPGGTNRAEYTGASESGDLTTYCMDCYGDNHRMRIEIDPLLDLGKRSDAFANGTKAAFSTDYGKCYFTIVNKDVSMAAGDMYCLRGSYEFTPR